MDDDWNRPYSPGSGRWLVIGWEAVAFGLLAWASVDLFGISGAGLHVLAMVTAAVWVVAGWRILEMGVYVRPAGLQIRGLLRSRTLRWDEIAHVRLHRHTNKIGRFEIEGGLTVLIERRDGSYVNTELFAQGIDFHRRPHVFREVYHELRDRHLAAASS
ncbi:PH domain-containing protein [Actinoplanes sp. RD1]|uniref:PH domain-containing protein n=1 Tax=Actinoplanes sp. RD1 TaxID=3064538 RepID=UPI002741DFBB|nr:PH domain-containing protein [Actinoplanes sp. RD1]